MPFLNQSTGENDHRKYFMINLHVWILPDLAGIEPATFWSPVGHTSDWATEAENSDQTARDLGMCNPEMIKDIFSHSLTHI